MSAAVDAIEREFYKAIEAHDLEAMARLWGHGDDVAYIGPDGSVAVGREPVLATLRQGFATAPLVRFDRLTRLAGYGFDADLAVTVNREDVSVIDRGTTTALIGNNHFRREEGRWYIVLHQATRISNP